MLSEQFLETYPESFLKIVQTKVKEKGWSYVFLRGVSIGMRYLIPFVLCLFIRLIKPLFCIRFGSLYAEKIGTFSSQPELNLCEQEQGIQPRDSFNIYCQGNSSFICNNQLYTMWKRILRVYPRSKYFWNVMNTFSFGKDHIIRTTKGSRDIHGLLQKTSVHLKFTLEEIAQAKQEMARMKIEDDDRYVLMINRGQRYLDEVTPFNMDFSYHTYRNCSIKN